MYTILNNPARCFISCILALMPLQVLNCQEVIITQKALNNLIRVQTLNYPQNVEILNADYSQVARYGSDSVKIAYGLALGMLYQKAVIENQTDDPAVLSASKGFYEDVLSIDRTQVPARKNLVLILKSQKDYDLALKHLDTLIKEDYYARSKYFYSKGELLLESKRYPQKEAVPAFVEVLRVEPDNYNVLKKILSVYTQEMVISDKKSLYDLAIELKTLSTPDPSMRLLEKYLEILPATDPGMEKGLTAWADLLSSLPYIPEDAFINLPSTVSSFTEKWKNLEQIVRHPASGTYYWWKSGGREYIPGRIRLEIAKTAISQGNLKLADSLFRIIYNETPRLQEIDMHIESQLFRLRMDLLYYLTTFFARLPQYKNSDNPMEPEFRILENEMFLAKAAFYRADDLAGIFRMHSLLGKIYAGQKNWGSLGNSRSAIFQLDHAATFYDKIVSLEPGFYRPLPEIYSQLGIGLSKTGDDLNASKYYFEACKAYLETDNLNLAEDYYQKSNQYQDKSYLADQKNEVKQILEIRKNIDDSLILNVEMTLPRKNFDDLRNKSDKKSDFLRRQYFKIYSDFGLLKATQGGSPETDYSKALLLISGISSLSGNQDMERLKRISQSLSGNTSDINQGYAYRIFIPQEFPDKKTINTVWTLNIQGSDDKLAIEIDPNLFLIAERSLQPTKPGRYKPVNNFQYDYKINIETKIITPVNQVNQETKQSKSFKKKERNR